MKIVLMLFFLLAWPAFGQVDPEEDLKEVEEQRKQWHLDPGFYEHMLKPYDDWREKLKEEHGLDWVVYYSTQFQQQSGGEGANTLNHEFDLIGEWKFADSENYRGSILLWAVHDFESFGFTDDDMAALLGSTFRTTGTSASFPKTQVRFLTLEQKFLNKKLHTKIGQIEPRSVHGQNRYANWDREDFFSNAFSNPVRNWPGGGLGVLVAYEPTDWFEFGASVIDAQGNARYPQFDNLGRYRAMYSGEIIFKSDFEELGKGNYHFVYSDINETPELPSGSSFELSFDQDLGEHVGSFFRYSRSFGSRQTLFEQSASGGLTILEPFGNKNDRWAFGAAWGRPSEAGLSDEWLLESYYKMQLARRVELCPGIQYIPNPSARPGAPGQLIWNFRMRLEL